MRLKYVCWLVAPAESPNTTVTMPSLLDASYPVYDTDLLRQLLGRRLSAQLKVLCVVGAHRFQERRLIDRVFPHLQHIYLFEPLPQPLAALRAMEAQDRRIRVFPFAISDRDGTARFNVTSNDGESSSLLRFGTHGALFPAVQIEHCIDVTTRRLGTVILEHGLAPPDALLIDTQGAEYSVLSGIAPELMAHVRVIYAEVSTEAVYESARLLPDIEKLLAERFVSLGFAPLRPEVPMHGNAVFVAHADVEDALALSLTGRIQRAWRHWRRRRKPGPASHAT